MIDERTRDATRLAELVKRARDLRDLTQKQLADEAGVSLRTVTRIEAGQKTGSTDRVLALLKKEIDHLETQRMGEASEHQRRAKEEQRTRLWHLLGQVSELFAELQSRVPEHTAPSVTDLFAELVSRYAKLEAQVREYESGQQPPADPARDETPISTWQRRTPDESAT